MKSDVVITKPNLKNDNFDKLELCIDRIKNICIL